VRIDMSDGSHRTEWGMFVEKDAHLAADRYIRHILSSDTDHRSWDDDHDATAAADEARREIEEELWQDMDDIADANESGWIYRDDDR